MAGVAAAAAAHVLPTHIIPASLYSNHTHCLYRTKCLVPTPRSTTHIQIGAFQRNYEQNMQGGEAGATGAAPSGMSKTVFVVSAKRDKDIFYRPYQEVVG